MKQKPEEEIKFCETHRVWYIDTMPCKSCKQDKKEKSKQEKTK